MLSRRFGERLWGRLPLFCIPLKQLRLHVLQTLSGLVAGNDDIQHTVLLACVGLVYVDRQFGFQMGYVILIWRIVFGVVGRSWLLHIEVRHHLVWGELAHPGDMLVLSGADVIGGGHRCFHRVLFQRLRVRGYLNRLDESWVFGEAVLRRLSRDLSPNILGVDALVYRHLRYLNRILELSLLRLK